MSKEDKILEHLKNKGSITPIDALNLYGSFRLGARIYDLKKKGYNISMIREGKEGYARYSLVKEII